MILAPAKKEPVQATPSREEILEGLKTRSAVVTLASRVPEPESRPADSTPARPAMKESTFEFRPFVRPEARTEAKTESVPVPAPEKKIQEKAEQVNTILPSLQKEMKVFGALFNTFILVEYENQLLLVDQHAVHERLLFDRLMKEHSEQRAGQELLVPIILSLSEKELRLADENRGLFESMGLVMERFGEHDIAVRTIPVVLGEAETGSFVREILAEVERNNTVTLESKRAAILQTACKHAIKGGEALSEDQLRSILQEMVEKQVTPTCPHGRPLVVSISHREIDKKFKRIQE
jgi:DNA mismatch repair protein MutL